MSMSADGILQPATIIAKTAQTDVGGVAGGGPVEIAARGYRYITFWLDYTKGDETGLLVKPWYKPITGGDLFQDQSWTATAGEKTATVNSFKMTATGKYYITLDLAGIEFVKLTQGGSNNDGAPTGTLAVRYTLTGSNS